MKGKTIVLFQTLACLFILEVLLILEVGANTGIYIQTKKGITSDNRYLYQLILLTIIHVNFILHIAQAIDHAFISTVIIHG